MIEVTEVNILLVQMKIYGHETMETIKFGKKLDRALLNNTSQLSEKEKRETMNKTKHLLIVSSCFCQQEGGLTVRK